jgi:hypothetical protein
MRFTFVAVISIQMHADAYSQIGKTVARKEFPS